MNLKFTTDIYILMKFIVTSWIVSIHAIAFFLLYKYNSNSSKPEDAVLIELKEDVPEKPDTDTRKDVLEKTETDIFEKDHEQKNYEELRTILLDKYEELNILSKTLDNIENNIFNIKEKLSQN